MDMTERYLVKQKLKENMEMHQDLSVKAVVSSGYSQDPVIANYKDYGFRDILPKPYTLLLLREIIAKLIDE